MVSEKACEEFGNRVGFGTEGDSGCSCRVGPTALSPANNAKALSGKPPAFAAVADSRVVSNTLDDRLTLVCGPVLPNRITKAASSPIWVAGT